MMTTDLPRRDAFNRDSITIRALSSITVQQADTIAQAVNTIAQDWEVLTMNDYDGYLSILIEPMGGNDEQNSFFVSGTSKRLELSETEADHISAIATYSDVQGLLAGLLGLLAF